MGINCEEKFYDKAVILPTFIMNIVPSCPNQTHRPTCEDESVGVVFPPEFNEMDDITET